MNKILKLFIVLLAFFIAGCTPVFIKENEQIVIDNATGQSENQVTLQNTQNSEDEILIKSINSSLTDGLVYDISKYGKFLLIGKLSSTVTGDVETVHNYLNLHTYDIKNTQLKQVLASSKQQVSGLIDNKNQGYLYIDYNTDKEGNVINNSYKLNWSDYDGNITKYISKSDESVSEKFSVTEDNRIIYGNTKGQIKFVDIDDINNDNRIETSYQLSEPLNIYKIDYYEKFKLAFFLAYNEKTNTTDLYYAILEKNNIDPIFLEENVTDFDMSTEKKAIIYCASGEKTNKLVYLDIFSYYNKKVLYEGLVGSFSFSLDGEKIIYSEKINESSNNENLWVMETDGSTPKQLASSLKIASDKIIFHPSKDIIYFSVYELDEKNSNEISYKVYTIDYSY
ncbi:MAG: hypothetical protein ACOWWH_12225 [Eubacteriaceae bacterium]